MCWWPVAGTMVAGVRRPAVPGQVTAPRAIGATDTAGAAPGGVTRHDNINININIENLDMDENCKISSQVMVFSRWQLVH